MAREKPATFLRLLRPALRIEIVGNGRIFSALLRNGVSCGDCADRADPGELKSNGGPKSRAVGIITMWSFGMEGFVESIRI